MTDFNGDGLRLPVLNEIPGILAVNPEGGKIARATGVSPLIEAGNVYLPHQLFVFQAEKCAFFSDL